MSKVHNLPKQYPELGRLYDDLVDVLDSHREIMLPRAAVIGVLVLIQDELVRESWDEQNT